MDWSNLKADYERLGSYSAVAAEYGVSKGYVAQQAKKQGINPKPESRSLEIDWSDLPSLYESGMTYDQLAARYRVQRPRHPERDEAAGCDAAADGAAGGLRMDGGAPRGTPHGGRPSRVESQEPREPAEAPPDHAGTIGELAP